MSKLIELIKAYLPKPRSQKDREETCLKDTQGVFDLERRMQVFDKHSSGSVMSRLVLGMEGH